MPSRMIRDQLLDSPTLDKVGAEAERLFVRLLLVADDFGRFCSDPSTVLARCFPRRVGAMLIGDVDRWLTELAAPGVGAIVLYRVGERRFGCFPSWDRHQKRRAKYSKFPAPPDGLPVGSESRPAVVCEQLSADVGRCEQMFASASRESRVESRESRSESVPEDVPASVDNSRPHADPVAAARSAVSVPWTDEDRERIGKLLIQAREAYPRWWVQLGKLLSQWIAKQPPAEVVAAALGKIVEAKADNPCAYLTTVIRKETPNWHEANAISRHEERKREIGTESRGVGGMASVGDILHAALIRAGPPQAVGSR
jgi:hypothetical protein